MSRASSLPAYPVTLRMAARIMLNRSGCAAIRSAAGDGGDDAHFVGGLQRRLQGIEEADIFAVDVDVHEAPDLALLVADAVLDAGVLLLQAIDGFAERAGIGLDDAGVVRKASERL